MHAQAFHACLTPVPPPPPPLVRSPPSTHRPHQTFDSTKFPKHFQIGTVQDDPLSFYGGRLSKRERKSTLTDELLADTQLRAMRKKRYARLQDAAQSRGKGAKRRKTELPRDTKKKPRPKH